MNQSNKALRDGILEIAIRWREAVEKLEKIDGKLPSKYLEDATIALVTNHIKEALPKDYRRDGQDPNACLNHDKYTGACAACQRQQTRVYTLDEVQSILEEVSNEK